LNDKLLFIQLRISRSVAFRLKLLNSDFILEIFNSGKRGVTRRGWERMVWFERLFIGREWCVCVFWWYWSWKPENSYL